MYYVMRQQLFTNNNKTRTYDNNEARRNFSHLHLHETAKEQFHANPQVYLWGR